MYRDAPTSTSLVQHGVALALRGRCPFCAEVTAKPGILSGTPCDVCGGAFTEDERFGERVVSEMEALTRERFGTVLATATLAAALAGTVPFLGLVANLVALVVFRLWVVGPCLSLLAGTRRLVARWTLRLGTAWLLALTGLLLAIPCAAFVQTALVVGVVWWSGRAYLLWQLRRERAREPVAIGEWLLLGGVVAAMLFAIGVVLSLATTIYGFLSDLGEWMPFGGS
ncbi:MAG: hypothetical protein H6722_17355 [Sandaracinus sp.]|nr:hypothetical protein [Sandaracinus sp.]MCB9614208.1 hypothetical protein [Sandaracinus sp.]MCB9620099.1 hypothetical protein [Sandaracinus sp.]MCB9622529.1 hypothetical protein [Sandaracinus sp.]